MQTSIINHYPPAIKQIKEMQQIAKAEDIEFSKLYASIDRVIRNMFIKTADEDGVTRFEHMLGITPKSGQSLDDRKTYILFVANRKEMSLSELKVMLSSYYEKIRLVNDFYNMEMIVEIDAGSVDVKTVNEILEEILPLNIYFTIKTRLEAERTNADAFALHRREERLKVKAFVQDSLKAGADGKIKAYMSCRQTMRIRKEGE